MCEHLGLNKHSPTMRYTASDSEIARALDYVASNERRVKSAHIGETWIDAIVEFRSPQYTVRPVSYLSSSELAISTAQVAHVFIDHYVRRPDFEYADLCSPVDLAAARMDHALFFIDWSVSFRDKWSDATYKLQLRMGKSRRLSSLLYCGFTFLVGQGIKGKFNAVIPCDYCKTLR